MNCSECEQLFDAYLDGQLAGSLRLEFDAHRLRCQHCQQSLAMLESLGHVIGSGQDVPDLSGDFADRVMERIDPPRLTLVRRPRLLVVASAVAAGLALAIFWQPQATHNDRVATSETRERVAIVDNSYVDSPQYQVNYHKFLEAAGDYVWEVHNAGSNLKLDFTNLMRYLDLSAPADVARDSGKMAGCNAWEWFWGEALPSDEEESEPSQTTEELHWI